MLALLTVALLAGPPPNALLELKHHDYATRNAAAERLARFGREGVDAIVAAVKADRGYNYQIGLVLDALDEPLRTTETDRLLGSTFTPAVEWAAQSVGDKRRTQNLPAIRAALVRTGLWHCANTLHTLDPGPASTQLIVDAGRRHGKPPENTLFMVVDVPENRHLLSRAERLHYLLESKVAGMDGPTATDGDPADDASFSAYLDADDLKFLRENAGDVGDRLLRQLKDAGHAGAALLLAWLEDRRALPILRRRYLHDPEFYGWETSFPNPLTAGNYPKKQCYEKAITHLTGKPLKVSVTLRRKEVATLLGRKDSAAHYLLLTLDGYRHREHVLKQMAQDPFYRSNAVSDDPKLVLRAKKTTVKTIFGQPTAVTGDRWTYYDQGFIHPTSLILRFKDGAVVEVSRTVH